MTRFVSVCLLVVGIAGLAGAQVAPVPEIDPGTGLNALALLAGMAIVVRASLKK